MVLKRLELASTLNIDGEVMSLELWRMEDNTYTVEITGNNMRLTANANITIELEDFIKRAHSFIKRVR